MIRLKRLLQLAALVAVSTALAFGLLELAVRVLAPQQLITLRPDIWQPDHEGFGWRHAPGADTTINTGERTVRWRTDGRGHRLGEPEETATAAPAWRVLALGDSFLEAIQVEDRDTVTARLEAMLESRLGAPGEVVNTGVGGWGPNHYLMEARAELARQRYRAVVVFVFAGNDVISRTEDHFQPRQTAVHGALRLPRTLARGELIDAVAYPINDALERRSHLFMLAKSRLKFLLMRWGLSAHYFPSALREGAIDEASWPLTADRLREIAELAAAHGVPTLVAILPGVYQVDRATSARYAAALGIDPATVDLDQPQRRLAPLLRARGIPFVDTTPALRRALDQGRGPLYGHVDTHLAPAGHAVVAETVLAPLLALMAPEPPS